MLCLWYVAKDYKPENIGDIIYLNRKNIIEIKIKFS